MTTSCWTIFKYDFLVQIYSSKSVLDLHLYLTWLQLQFQFVFTNCKIHYSFQRYSFFEIVCFLHDSTMTFSSNVHPWVNVWHVVYVSKTNLFICPQMSFYPKLFPRNSKVSDKKIIVLSLNFWFELSLFIYNRYQ